MLKTILAILTAMLIIFSASAKTLNVPQEYKTVAEAVKAAVAGDTVLLKAGVYKGPFFFKTGLTIKGEDRDKVILQYPATKGAVFTLRRIRSGSIESVKIIHTDVDKLDPKVTSRPSLIDMKDSSVNLRDCHLIGAAGNAIFANGRSNTRIENCIVQESAWNGMYLGSYGSCSIIVESCTCEDNVASGIKFADGTSGIAEDNTCRNNGNCGIMIANASSSAVVNNNRCDSNTGGILFVSGGSGTAASNTCQLNKFVGIGIRSVGSSATIVGNTCEDNLRSGISIYEGARGIFRNNISNSNENGILSSSPGTHSIIQGNQCSLNSKYGIIFIGGSTGEAENNVCNRNKYHGIMVSDASTSCSLIANHCELNSREGIKIRRNGVAVIRSNTSINNRHNGIMITNVGTWADVSENQLRDNKYSGCTVEKSACATIKNNTCENNTKQGIFVKGMKTYADITGNLCSGNKSCGVHITDGALGKIKENQLVKNKYCGARVHLPITSATFTSNQCDDNGRFGIEFCKGAAGAADKNRCNGNGEVGIIVHNTDTHSSLTANQCDNNKEYGILIASCACAQVENNIAKNNEKHDIAILHKNTEAKLAGNQITSSEEDVHRDQSKSRIGTVEAEHVKWLVKLEKFDQLEAMATFLHENNPRYNNGSPQIEEFYDSLYVRTRKADPKEQKAQLKRIRRWMVQYSNSYASKIAMAETYIGLGWECRGSGMANTVTADGWKDFRKYFECAWSILEDAEKHPDVNPAVHNRMMTLGMGLGLADDKMDEILERGAAMDPTYYPLYYTRAWSLMPRWSGRRGLLEKLAERAAELTKETDGDALYANLVLKVCAGREAGDMTRMFNFSYPRLKKYYETRLSEDLEYKQDFITNACFFACIYGEIEDARKYFEQLEEPVNHYYWGDRAIFDSMKKWATADGFYPTLPTGMRGSRK
jgi:nitrous oxidase accessory protein NosD